MSDSLQPHGLQHTRLPCPSPTPRACSNLCPSSPWCHPTVSSSVVPFSFCLQSYPASGTFPMSQFFALGGQNTGASTLASVFPMNIQDWFPLGLAGLFSLWPRNSHKSSPTPQFKSTNSSVLSFIYGPALTPIHDYWKNHGFDYTDPCQYSNHMTGKVLQKLVYRYEQTSSKVYMERQQTQTSQYHIERRKLENY